MSTPPADTGTAAGDDDRATDAAFAGAVAVDTSQPPPDPGRPRRRRRARRKHSPLRNTIEWVLIIAGALLVALVIKATLVQAFYIPSESMVPTLNVRDRVLVNKLSYKLHDVHRGDIVVFERPPGETDPRVKDLIKRVIGLPGETIEERGGRVFVDGKAIDESYLPPGTQTTALPKQTIPADHYFVMGDNRANSRDSRVFKAIDEDLIVGRAFVRVWPLSELDFL